MGKLTPRNLWDIPSAITTFEHNFLLAMKSAVSMPFTRYMAINESINCESVKNELVGNMEKDLGIKMVRKLCTRDSYVIACYDIVYCQPHE